MAYEVLLFDADNTLFDFDIAEKEALEKTMLEQGMAYDYETHFQLYKEVNHKIWKELEEGKITQERLKSERFKRFGNEVGIEIDAKEASKRYLHHLSYASYLFPDSMNLIKDLSEKYTIAILTNGLTAVQHRRVRGADIAKHCQGVFISEEIGLSKPDKAIFDFVLGEMSYGERDKVLMIGDSLTSDIQGGINAGIDTCWYNIFNKENATGIEPTYEIKSLKELAKILL